jgi:hypothetical protein
MRAAAAATSGRFDVLYLSDFSCSDRHNWLKRVSISKIETDQKFGVNGIPASTGCFPIGQRWPCRNLEWSLEMQNSSVHL